MNFLKNTDNNADLQLKKKARIIQIVGAVSVCIIIAVVFLYCYFRYGKQIYEIFGNIDNLKAFLAPFKGFDKWVFVAIRAFQTVIKIIPAEPLEIGSGVLYGTWGGMLLCLLGTMLGSLVIIALTRAFGRRIVEVFIPIEKINSLKFLQNKKRVYISLFLIYLLPGTPKDILTYAAGITDIDMKKFLLITGIARIPSIIVSTLCGEQLIEQNYTLAIIIFVATTVATVLCSVIYKKILAPSKKKNESEDS